MKILNRIERLEDELLPLSAGDTIRWTIHGIGEDGEVAETITFDVQVPPQPRRRWVRRPVARRDW